MKKLLLLALLALSVGIVGTAYAQDKTTDPDKTPTTQQTTQQQTPTTTQTQPTGYRGQGEPLPPIESPVKATNLTGLITQIIQYLLGVIALVSIIVIMVSGFRLMISRGNETATYKAKQGITFAIIGLILALFSFAIVTIIQSILQP